MSLLSVMVVFFVIGLIVFATWGYNKYRATPTIPVSAYNFFIIDNWLVNDFEWGVKA